VTAFWIRHRWIILICAVALLLRLAYRLGTGSEEFWSNGYRFLYEAAQNLVAGRGLTYSQPHVWSVRVPPVYPLLLAPTVLLGGHYLTIVVPQALISTGTVLCAFLIGQELFTPRAGLIAAALAAIYPYYVVHDTALQETGLLTFWMALSVWMLLRARVSAVPRLWLASGVMLGLSMLVRTTAAPFALGAVVWTWMFGAGSSRQRMVRALATAACVAAIAGAWMGRNAQMTGRLTLATGTGYAFWVAHNPQTFNHYPAGNIEVSARDAFAALPPADWQRLMSFTDANARDDWYMARARAYLQTQSTSEKLTEAARKVLTGFSWVLTPGKPGLTQWVYFLSYTPVLLFGLAGMALTWRDWRRQSLIYLQFLIFIAVSAVMWAHTSYRSVLDVYLMIFAGTALDRLWRVLRAQD